MPTTAPNCPFDITPLDQSQLTPTPKLSALSYTHQDFWSMKTRLVNFIYERFPKDFNDFVESSLAMMIIENFAFLADTISFKLDQYINELFIDSVTEIENAFRLSRLVGFKPTPPIAATAMFSASLNNVLSAEVVIPGGVLTDITVNNTILSYELYAADVNNNPLFEEDILIPAGSLTNTTIVGVEGKTLNDTFRGTGLINQNAQLIESPVLFDSIRVTVDGIKWQPVEYFTDSQPRREYRIEYDSLYRAYVIFGNNRAGLVPPEGAVINVVYRVGGGNIGNIISGALQFSRQYNVPALNFPVPVTFRNYTRGSNGYNGDGIEDIRLKLPAYLKSQDRCVTGEDYKTMTENFTTAYNGKVGKASAVLRNYGCAGNIIDLFILARNGTDGLIPTTDELKFQLNTMLETKKMLTDYCCIRDGVVLLVDITIDIIIDKSLRKLREEIDTRVRSRISQFFSLNNWEYGKTLRDTDLIKQLSDIKELDSVDVTFVTNDEDNSGAMVTTKYYEVIRPDDIAINYNFQ
jgi:hypothetical protein